MKPLRPRCPALLERFALLLVGGVLLGFSPSAEAQSRQSSSGGSMGSSTGGGVGGQGVSGQGVSGQGVSGQGVGGSNTGAGSPNFMGFGTEVDTTGGTGFVGRNSAGTFVGGTVQPGQGQAGNMTALNSMFNAINRQGQVNRSTQPTGPSRSQLIRPRHRIAFSISPRQTQSIATTLKTRMDKLPSPVAGVDVTLDAAGLATIRGTAATAHDAKLAAALARLEPGVRKVDNQLTVSDSK